MFLKVYFYNQKQREKEKEKEKGKEVKKNNKSDQCLHFIILSLTSDIGE